MRLPAPSYAVESVLGAAVVILCVVFFFPDPTRRKADAPAVPAEPAPRPVPAPAPLPAGPTDEHRIVAAEAIRVSTARMWGERVAERREVVAVDPKRRAKVWADHLDEVQGDLVGVFDTTPGAAAPWADLARTVMTVRARMTVEAQLTGRTSDTRLREDEAAREKAVAAGCDDPLVRFWHARARTNDGLDDPAAFRAAVERVYASPYPPARRLPAVYNWLVAAQGLRQGHPLRADAAQWEARFWELFEAVARVHTVVADEDLIDYSMRWQNHRRAQGRSRADALAELDRHLRRAGARDYLRRTVRGDGLVLQAWDARGSGVAGTVADDAWEVFRGHLGEAREVLADACESDPDGYTAPTRLLSVCNGLAAPRGEMEDAFRRAMFANPDNSAACYMRLEYLHPKWHGSQDRVDYLHACWALALYPGDGWVQTAMLSNLFANFPIAGPRFDINRGPLASFYGSPDGFDLVWTACRAIEAGRPTESYTANLMPRVACVGRRYGVAHEMFLRLGPNFSREVYADQDDFDRFRREAEVIP